MSGLLAWIGVDTKERPLLSTDLSDGVKICVLQVVMYVLEKMFMMVNCFLNGCAIMSRAPRQQQK